MTLTVEDARSGAIETLPPEVGIELYIRCRVSALGPDIPDSVSLVFRVDGSIVRELSVPVSAGVPLPVGEYWTPAGPGPHEVGCEVNPDRKIEEKVYADNALDLILEVRPKGSAVAAAAASPARNAARRMSPSAAAIATPPPPAPRAAAAPVTQPRAAVSSPSATLTAPAPALVPAPPPGATAAVTPPATAPPAHARPDLAIVGVQTVADPSCDSRDPKVTVRVTVTNVGEGPYAPARNAALVDVTVRMPNDVTLVGRKPVPQLSPGASAELDVVSRSRRPIPSAGGLRYSVVVTVNSDGRIEETTLDNNGEYVKAAFPRC